MIPKRLLINQIHFAPIFAVLLLCCEQAHPQIKKCSLLQEDCLADGSQFPFWEKAQQYVRTYFVDTKNPKASDQNNGTAERPFKTISRAAQLLQPGERVIIKGGIYRECVVPARGGSAPDKMITYEAAPGENVVISGSIELDEKRWQKGQGWVYGRQHTNEGDEAELPAQIWQYDFDGSLFGGYNPFGMLNLMEDREYLQIQKVKMDAHFKRRGMIFLNGKPIEQVAKPTELLAKEKGAFWVEHNGMRIHVRFPGKTGPGDYLVEATAKEQVFVPAAYGLGYIAIKGITFRHAGNGFPVPQRGMVSTNRGNHWIVEDCTIEWANSVGIDMGNEMWSTVPQKGVGNHIVRHNIIRHCGIGGLEAMGARQMLVEDNLFEDIGWQDAELAFESGAIKIHHTYNTMIRRNVFRHITHAPGIWMDFLANKNLRITNNVFTDISSARGAIYIEVSRNDCLIDRNIFHQLHCEYWVSGDYGAGGNALYTDGSDSIRFCNNLMLDIENTGYGDYLNAERIVGKRGGVTRWHSVMNNIFIGCGKYAIEFPNEYNFSNGNIFSSMSAGYLKMTNPAPSLLLDLEAWQKLYDWEKDGQVARIKGDLDNRKMQLTLYFDSHELNLHGRGPFDAYASGKKMSIDPRKGSKSGNINQNSQ